MTPPVDARCPNCGGYPRTEAQLAWRQAHPRSQRRWCRMKMRCLYRATDEFDPPGHEYTVGDAVGLRRME